MLNKNIFFRIWTTLLAIVLLTVSVAADTMSPFEISMQNLTNARIGDSVSVSVNFLSGTEKFASFKFLISYDATRLSLTDVKPGNAVSLCGWESFQWTANLLDGGAVNGLEITAVADLDNGSSHPSCLSTVGELAKLVFKVNPDTTLVGSYAPINFYWFDCSSNTVNSAVGDTTWHGRFVYDYLGNEITGADPHLGGTLSGCITPGDVVQIRGINCHDGGVAISSSYGAYGDLNSDGRFNLSDLAYFINYIFVGGPAPMDYLHGDYTGDGIVSISDAVYLLNYLFGRTP
jgi:hypothetical protein